MTSEISHIEQSGGTAAPAPSNSAHNDELIILDINAVKAGELDASGL
jgi:hypothetical protein